MVCQITASDMSVQADNQEVLSPRLAAVHWIEMMSQHPHMPPPSTGRISALSVLRQHVISHSKISAAP